LVNIATSLLLPFSDGEPWTLSAGVLLSKLYITLDSSVDPLLSLWDLSSSTEDYRAHGPVLVW